MINIIILYDNYHDKEHVRKKLQKEFKLENNKFTTPYGDRVTITFSKNRSFYKHSDQKSIIDIRLLLDESMTIRRIKALAGYKKTMVWRIDMDMSISSWLETETRAKRMTEDYDHVFLNENEARTKSVKMHDEALKEKTMELNQLKEKIKELREQRNKVAPSFKNAFKNLERDD